MKVDARVEADDPKNGQRKTLSIEPVSISSESFFHFVAWSDPSKVMSEFFTSSNGPSS